MKVKPLFLEALKSRMFVSLWIVALIQMIVFVAITIVNLHVGGATIRIHCDLGGGVPDCTSHGDSPWYYTLNFGLFAIVSFVFTIAISLKLLQAKGRSLALAWLWLMVAVSLIVMVLLAAIMHIAEF